MNGLRLALVILALGTSSCTRARTQIVLQIRTNMIQGPSGELSSIAVRVYSDGVTDPHFDEAFDLGESGATIALPTTLGLVPDARRDGFIRVEIDARDAEGRLIFTKRARAQYVPERTLLLDMVLAARCLSADARACGMGESCGPEGCEADTRETLPEYRLTNVPPVQRADAGPVECLMLCDGACVDSRIDVDHCGACDRACPVPEYGAATCADSACGIVCAEEHHRCEDACVSNRGIDHCGDRCTPCPGPAENGIASCDGSCGFVCNPGFQSGGDSCVPGPNVEPPRPLWPPDLSRVSSLRPTFRWSSAAAADGALLQVCRDRACDDIVAQEPASGSTLRLSTALSAGSSGSRRLFYRLFGRNGDATGETPSVVWSFVIPARDHEGDTAYGRVDDIDGDGLADLLLGSEDDSVRMMLGQADAAPRGVPGALSQTPGAAFGTHVAAVGDVDGDGYGDVLVGAPGIRRAYLYRGSPSGVTSAPVAFVGAADSGFGEAVASAGDFNGDGYGDIAVGSPAAGTVSIFLGGTSPDTSADITLRGGAGFGASITSVGDLDGDGFEDLAVGAPAAASVYLFRGSMSTSGMREASAADQTLVGAAGSRFGASIAGGVDVNGDGRPDLLVGVPGVSAQLFAGGGVGLSEEPARVWTSSTPGFATHVLGLGDVDGDGFDDWVAGAPASDTALLYRGGEDGGSDENARAFSPGGVRRFGDALAGPGDLDGDGFADLVVGAPGSRSVRIYRFTRGNLDGDTNDDTDTRAGHGAALACRPRTRSERPT